MKILGVQFEGFNKHKRQFAYCIILIKEIHFSVSTVYEISCQNQFPICSEIKVNVLDENKYYEAGGEFLKPYLEAKNNGYSFLSFPESLTMGMNPYKLPRFSEIDFENIVKESGGIKIPTSKDKTPDFLLNNIVLELKDLQTDGLLNIDRQNSIASIFNSTPGYTFDLDPTIYHEGLTEDYHRLIANTIQNHIKKASTQIKAFMKKENVESAGIIMLNTGLFSVPHELLKSIIQDILIRLTNTIKFAFIFSQTIQTNGFDSYAIFNSEFIGSAPESIKFLKEKLDTVVNEKMTRLIQYNDLPLTIDSQHPISFLAGNKIFYWNPGRVPDSRMVGSEDAL